MSQPEPIIFLPVHRQQHKIFECTHITCSRGLTTWQFYVAWKRFYVIAKVLMFTLDSLFICTQVSHLLFPVDNYLGIIHNNTYSIKLKYFWSSVRWRLACKLVPYRKKTTWEHCLSWNVYERCSHHELCQSMAVTNINCGPPMSFHNTSSGHHCARNSARSTAALRVQTPTAEL